MSPELPSPRGAADLAELWRSLPVAVATYPAAALPPHLGIARLSDTLRKRAWREHCAAGERACATVPRNCELADTGRCRADQLFPVRIGGGARQWRMATLLVQVLRRAELLRVVALGETAVAELGWATQCLAIQHGLTSPQWLKARRLADLQLRGGERWLVDFVTPWIVAKASRHGFVMPDCKMVQRELAKSMTSRAQKLTALCAREATWQRIGSHLARHVADALLPAAIAVDEVRVELCPLQLEASEGCFDALAWTGSVRLRIATAALPWLNLLAVCGGGENPDKGFGGVEVTPQI
jgi:hypothetical protein